MWRLAPLAAAIALTVFLVTGCGAGARKHGAESRPGRFPVVVAHPSVRTSGLQNVKISHGGAVLLSASRLAFVTTGTVSCVWLPSRLTVLGPSSIRLDMRVDGDVASCGSGGAGFPIAVRIGGPVDVHRPLTVRLDYRVRVGERTQHFGRTVVAPALSRS